MNPMDSRDFSLSKSNNGESFKKTVGVEKINRPEPSQGSKSFVKKIGSYFFRK